MSQNDHVMALTQEQDSHTLVNQKLSILSNPIEAESSTHGNNLSAVLVASDLIGNNTSHVLNSSQLNTSQIMSKNSNGTAEIESGSAAGDGPHLMAGTVSSGVNLR